MYIIEKPVLKDYSYRFIVQKDISLMKHNVPTFVLCLYFLVGREKEKGQ